MTIRLSIDARMLSYSGIGTVIQNLIQTFLAPPFQTCLLMRKKEELYAFNNISICEAPIYSIQEQWALPRAIPASDLFWSPHYNIPLAPIRAKKRVVTIHDACHLALPKQFDWKVRLYAKIMLKQAVAQSDAIITDSYFSQNELSRFLGINPNAMHVIYPGVDFPRFSISFDRYALETLQIQYKLPSSFFLFVGNVKPHKNISLILDVYEEGAPELPLVILGKKEGLRQTDPVLQRIESSPKLKRLVHLTGKIPDNDLPAFYQMATALLFPSLYEGFGLPPLEAMASGCPVIVSNCASLPEVCGDAVHYFDPTSVDALQDAMRMVLNCSVYRDTLREKGVKQAKKFSWENTRKNYRRVFQEICLL